MPRLTRLRFVSVGHPSARMDDLLLDLRDRRGRATASTLWLRNGGGKSSLLNLFLAIVRPDRRDFLGGRADQRGRRLEDYVLPDDRAVTAAEWELDPPEGALALDLPPERLLTGVFYEHQRGASGRPPALKRLFFAARACPGQPASTIAGLPLEIEVDGARRRRTLAAFRREWLRLGEAHPEGRFVASASQRDWHALLERAGLDPELFAYQVKMNLREGGADELFRFPDAESFVDFLLELAYPPELADRVARNIATFRSELVRRKREFLPERELVVGLAERLAPLRDVAVERGRALRDLGRAELASGALDIWLGGRLSDLADVAEARAAERDAARQATRRLRRAARARRLEALALERHAALAAVERARRELAAAERGVAEARQRVRTWEAAVVLRNARRFERRARDLRAELAAAEAANAPLAERLGAAAAALAAALGARAAAERGREGAHRRAEAEARAAVRAAQARALEAAAERARLEGRRRNLERRLARAAETRGALIEGGVLGPDEAPEAAAARLRASLEDADQRRASLARAAREDRARLDELDAELEQANRAAAAAEGEARALERDIVRARAVRRDLAANPTLLAALELEQLDPDPLADQALRTLERQAREAREEVVRLRAARLDDERALAHLEEHGLAPPRRAVERVLDALEGRVPARSGWEHLEATLPVGAARRDAVRAAPQLAGGVVVAAGDVARAKAALEAVGVVPDEPVVLTTPEAFAAADPGGEVLGPAGSARFDRRAARGELAVLHARADEAAAAVRRAEVAERERRDLIARFEAYRRAHPRGWLRQREQQLADARATLSRAEGRVQALRAERAERRGRLEERRALRHTLADARAADAERLRRLTGYVADHAERSAERREALASARAELARLARATEADAGAVADTEARAEAAARAARGAGEDARALEEERRGVEYAEADAPASMEAGAPNVDALRERYLDLKSTYEEEIGVGGRLQAARENERSARRERAALGRALAGGVVEADAAALLVELADPDGAEAARERAIEEAQGATAAVGRWQAERAQAARELERAEAACAAESGEVPELVEAPGDAGAAAAEAEARAAEAEWAAQADQQLAAGRRAEQAAARAAERASALERDHARLQALVGSYADMFEQAARSADDLEGLAVPAGDDEVPGRIAELERQLGGLRRRSQALDVARREASAALAAHLADPRFEALRTPLVARFRAVGDEDLEQHAEVFLDQLALRREHLDRQLEDVDRHRVVLVREALSIADDALAVLDQADRRSRLPEHLDGLGGARFLEIAHSAPDDPQIRQQIVGRLVDELVDGERFPGGVALVQRVVRRLARPLKVRVLHPDPAGGRRHVGIAELARLSGGEQLTGAILLYCTLASLRARSRGLSRQPSSVLVLDNPIGRASRARFLELQREVARAMGVQLVYTTAVHDHEALSALPNLVCLRNERHDRARGHRIVELTDAEQVTGWIEGVRVLREAGA